MDALGDARDDRIVEQFRFDTMTQSSEGLDHDAIPLAIVEQIPLREIWMGLDLNHSRLYPRDIEHLFQLRQTNIRQSDRLAPTFVHQALQSLPGICQRRRVVINHITAGVSWVLLVAGLESEWSMGAV